MRYKCRSLKLKVQIMTVLNLACLSIGFAQNQNVNLIANVNDYPQLEYNDVWGYTAPNSDEYALLGTVEGVSIVNVTDPNNIAEVDYVPFASSTWYDMKTYQDYMYVATEGASEILIVDLSPLPDSASVVGRYSGLTSSPHNIFIDTEMGILYVIEDFNFNPSVRILSLSDPTNPHELSTINSSNGGTDSHDAFAQDSVLYVAEGSSPTIGIFDVSDPTNPFLLSRLPIPAGGYSHQVWVTEDNKYMVTTEETVGQTVKIWDIQDLDNISLMSEYLGGSQLAHNAYFKDNLIYVSHYESGLKVLDYTDPAEVTEVGFYDTYPQRESPDFNGAWGVYPFTQNGTTLVSDTQTGLYVLQFDRESGPQIVISPGSIDFGNVPVGTMGPPVTVTLKNFGTEDLTVTDISDPGAPFHLSGVPPLPLQLAPNAMETFTVSFSPTSIGFENATLTITSNDADAPVYDLPLAGEGLVVEPAEPGVCYASTGHRGGTPGSLLTIDATTGAGTFVGFTGLFAVPGLAINSSGDIYATEGFSQTGVGLYRIDASTGRASFIGNTGQVFMDAIAFDENDVLYGLGGDPPIATLFTIDVSTGEATPIGSTGFYLRGMAFDPLDGTLWASEGASRDNIVTIDVSTGEATLVGSVGLGGSIPDIHFDQAGNLYGCHGGGINPNNLLSIDKSTGAGTVIGSIGFQAVSGLATARRPEGSQILVSPLSIDFGKVEVGAVSSPQTVTLQSLGTDDLTITDVSDPGSPFTLSEVPSLPVVIPSGASETFEVTFSPDDTVISNGAVTISSDDTSDPTQEVLLNGEGFVINPAQPGICYASTGSRGPNAGSLLTIDPATGAGTFIGSTGLDAVPGLAINTAGEIYGTDRVDGNLYRIDAVTGTAVFAASTGLFGLQAIAFDGNDVLYGVSFQSSGGGNLYIIEPTTGDTTLVGPTADVFAGLAFDPIDGSLWASTSGAVASVEDGIFLIDPTTGEASQVGTTELGGATPDIHFDMDGNLFGVKGGGNNTNNFITIDKATGEGTVIGEIGFQAVSGLAALTSKVSNIDDPVAEVPTEFSLSQNYPNPFNPTTTIEYNLPEAAAITIKIYNLLGEVVATLVDNQPKQAGRHKIVWDSRETLGNGVASGLYFIRMQAGQFVQTRKMLLVQ